METIEVTAETGKYPDGWSKIPCHTQAVEGHIKVVSEVPIHESVWPCKEEWVCKKNL